MVTLYGMLIITSMVPVVDCWFPVLNGRDFEILQVVTMINCFPF